MQLSPMPEFSLYKSEKLCSQTAVSRLFAGGLSAKSYPLRAVFAVSHRAAGAPARFLITIPKKKIRKAVDRVQMRRRVREAYRLNRQYLVPLLREREIKVDIAFIYLSEEKKDYALIEQKMQSLLAQIAEKTVVANSTTV